MSSLDSRHLKTSQSTFVLHLLKMLDMLHLLLDDAFFANFWRSSIVICGVYVESIRCLRALPPRHPLHFRLRHDQHPWQVPPFSMMFGFSVPHLERKMSTPKVAGNQLQRPSVMPRKTQPKLKALRLPAS